MSRKNGKPKTAVFKRIRDNYSKRKIRELIMYLRGEFGNSTNRGLPYIMNEDIHWIERLFWMVSYAFSVAMISVLLCAQYVRYLKAPVVMSVEKDYFNWNVSFPAITLCPLYKIDEERRTAVLNEILVQQEQHYESELRNYLEDITYASLATIHVFRVPPPHILRLIKSSDYAAIAAKISKSIDNMTLSTNTLSEVGVEQVMTEVGMCHAINSNVAGVDNPAKWNDTIVYTKKNIELSFYESDFFVQILNYADMHKIYTHSPNEIILSDARALFFRYEGFLSFGVQMSGTRASPDLKAMAVNLRKCRFVEEPISKRYPVYSYNRCLMECRITMIKALCGCVPHFYKPTDDEKVCNLAELKCLAIYILEIASLSASNETLQQYNFKDGLPRTSADCGCLGDCDPDFYRRELETFLPQENLKQLKVIVAKFPKVRIVREIIFSSWDIVREYLRFKDTGKMNLSKQAVLF